MAAVASATDQSSSLAILTPLCTTVEASRLSKQSSSSCEANSGITVKGRYTHSDALFGTPQYSGKLSGRVFYGTPDDHDACMPYPTPTPWEETVGNDMPAIIMIDRGDCTFVQKVRNAQQRSANAVIIVDNNHTGNLPIMADDGTGSDVDIPAVFISWADGEKIKGAIASGQTVGAELSWHLPAPDNRVEWSFWTSANDDESVSFVEGFKQVYEAMGDHAELTPHYLIIDGRQFQCNGPDLPCAKQCTHDGLYCAEDPEHDFETGLDGDDIVGENLRQICLWETLKAEGTSNKWWDYVSIFDERCEEDRDFHQQCSETQQAAAGLTAAEIAKVRDCVEKSHFCEGAPTATSQDACRSANGVWKNTKLEAELEARRKDGIYILPTILINEQKYRGRLTCPHPIWMESCGVLQGICAAFADPNVAEVCTEGYCWEVKDDCGDCRSSRNDPKFNRSCCADESGVFRPNLKLDPCGVCGGTGSFDKCSPPLCRQADDPDRDKVCTAAVDPSGKTIEPSNDESGMIAAFILILAALGSGTVWYIRRKERRMKTYVENIVANYMPLQDGGGAMPQLGQSARMGTVSDKDDARMLPRARPGITIDLGGGSPNQSSEGMPI
jgi:hypothetical protein